MPRITLKSGAWIDIRDTYQRSDRKAAAGAFDITISADGTRTMPGNLVDLQADALLAERITAWGGPGLDGVPVPSQHPLGAAVLDEVITDEDDDDALAEAIRPILERVNKVPNPRAPTSS